MPLLIIAAVLFGVGGFVTAADERDKRIKEEQQFRATLERLEAELAAKEQRLADLRTRLDEKNDQVRILAAEVEMLRAQTHSFAGSQA